MSRELRAGETVLDLYQEVIDRERTKRTHSGVTRIVTTCPGCDRARKDCWSDPCAHLRVLKAGPISKLRAWVAAGGGRLRLHFERPHQYEPITSSERDNRELESR